MSSWTPEQHSTDPMANAIYNVAEQLSRLADATSDLLYGLKYSRLEGMSVAEAIEVGLKGAGDSVAGAIRSIPLDDAVETAAKTLADAIGEHANAVEDLGGSK